MDFVFISSDHMLLVLSFAFRYLLFMWIKQITFATFVMRWSYHQRSVISMLFLEIHIAYVLDAISLTKIRCEPLTYAATHLLLSVTNGRKENGKKTVFCCANNVAGPKHVTNNCYFFMVSTVKKGSWSKKQVIHWYTKHSLSNSPSSTWWGYTCHLRINFYAFWVGWRTYWWGNRWWQCWITVCPELW